MCFFAFCVVYSHQWPFARHGYTPLRLWRAPKLPTAFVFGCRSFRGSTQTLSTTMEYSRDSRELPLDRGGQSCRVLVAGALRTWRSCWAVRRVGFAVDCADQRVLTSVVWTAWEKAARRCILKCLSARTFPPSKRTEKVWQVVDGHPRSQRVTTWGFYYSNIMCCVLTNEAAFCKACVDRLPLSFSVKQINTIICITYFIYISHYP